MRSKIPNTRNMKVLKFGFWICSVSELPGMAIAMVPTIQNLNKWLSFCQPLKIGTSFKIRTPFKIVSGWFAYLPVHVHYHQVPTIKLPTNKVTNSLSSTLYYVMLCHFHFLYILSLAYQFVLVSDHTVFLKQTCRPHRYETRLKSRHPLSAKGAGCWVLHPHGSA